MELKDYLIDFTGFDWPKLFEKWLWNADLPAELTPWLMNRFGDLFFITKEGAVQGLMLDQGDVFNFAPSREEFIKLINEENNASEWFLAPLVNQCVAAGLTLQPGECYSFKHPAVVGGAPTPSNVFVVPVLDRYRFLGDIHGQIKDVPDGTQIRFELVGPDGQPLGSSGGPLPAKEPEKTPDAAPEQPE